MKCLPCLPPLPERTLEPRPALLSQTCAGAPVQFGKSCLLKLGTYATAVVTFVSTIELRLPWLSGVDAKTEVTAKINAMLQNRGSTACSSDAAEDTRADNENSRADLAVERLADTYVNAENHRIVKAAMMLIASPMVLVLVLPSAKDDDKKPFLNDWKLCAVPIAHLRPVGEEHHKESVQAEMNADRNFLKPLAVRLGVSKEKVKPLHVLQFFDMFMPQSVTW